MSKIVNLASFQADAEQTSTTGLQSGTVEVTLRGDTRRVSALLIPGRYLTAYGIAVRYQTGTKIWGGSVDHWLDSHNERLNGGFDSHRGRRVASVVGFLEDFAEDRREHMGRKS